MSGTSLWSLSESGGGSSEARGAGEPGEPGEAGEGSGLGDLVGAGELCVDGAGVGDVVMLAWRRARRGVRGFGDCR